MYLILTCSLLASAHAAPLLAATPKPIEPTEGAVADEGFAMVLAPVVEEAPACAKPCYTVSSYYPFKQCSQSCDEAVRAQNVLVCLRC